MPQRRLLLEECQASVAAQTVKCEHLVGEDSDGVGPSVLRNRLARRASTDWLLFLDDDDVLFPDAVQVLLDHAGDADIVYPWCQVDQGLSVLVNKLWDRDGLHKLNFIPVTVLMRRDAFEMLGGFRRVEMEDWDLWRRAELHDCRFKCVPEVLWHYRRHRGNNFQAAA